MDATLPIWLVTLALAGGGLVLGWGVAWMRRRYLRRIDELQTDRGFDPLTGCINRDVAALMLEHALQRSQRNRSALALVLVELDGFDEVHARRGRAMEETVLRLFAHTTQTRLRASDVFCRLGGPDFALILPDTDEAGAQRLSAKIRQAMRALDLRDDDGRAVPLGFSAGLAVTQGDTRPAMTAERLYSRADLAMYEARRAGGGHTVAAAGR